MWGQHMLQEWVAGLVGGAVIGCAGAVFLLMNGRIMGASGIIGGLADGSARKSPGEALSFLAGLVGVPAVIMALGAKSATHLTENIIVVVLAGLLVGVGTRLANGCTSGHGVCGISRLSLRGIVATVFYILAGAITIVLFRHVMEVI
ncbi:MAG: YeeE/YedE thiosulfate transporter family protein [Albidovulum sp.]